MSVLEIKELLRGNKAISNLEISWIPELVKEINIGLVSESSINSLITTTSTGDEVVTAFELLSSERQDKIISQVIMGRVETIEDIEKDKQRWILTMMKIGTYLAIAAFVAFVVVVLVISLKRGEAPDSSIVNGFISVFFEYLKAMFGFGA